MEAPSKHTVLVALVVTTLTPFVAALYSALWYTVLNPSVAYETTFWQSATDFVTLSNEHAGSLSYLVCFALGAATIMVVGYAIYYALEVLVILWFFWSLSNAFIKVFCPPLPPTKRELRRQKFALQRKHIIDKAYRQPLDGFKQWQYTRWLRRRNH